MAGWVGAAAEMALAALVLFAADDLAHLRLSVPGFFACWAAWPVGLFAGRLLRRGRAAPGWLARLVEVAAPGLVLNEVNLRLGPGLTLMQLVYAVVAVAVVVQGWRLWLGAAAAHGHGVAGETLRLLAVGAAGVWIAGPLFTDLLVGGVDARWYAYMLGDFLAQWRAGVFPVFLGQGALAFNGAVHPFRSAPLYQYLAGGWDTLTWHALTPVALQHLTAITAAMAAALGMYAVLTVLGPTRRWLAASVAVVYVASPAFLGPLYLADQYMTYLAAAAMPWCAGGNLLILQGQPGRGWRWVAVGLMLTWLCHPPLAVLCTLATAALQGGRLALAELPPEAGRQTVGGILLFVLLGAFYFVSMAEVPNPAEPSTALMVLALAGAALGMVGIARGVLWGRGWGWLSLLLGGILLWRAQPVWMVGMASAAVVAGALAGGARWRRRFEPHRQGWWMLAAALAVAAVITPFLYRGAPQPGNPDEVALLADYARRLPEFFRPALALGGGPGDFRPGIGVWTLVAALAWATTMRPSWRWGLWFGVTLALTLCCLPVPGVAGFWMASVPRAFVEMVNPPLVSRLLPPVVAFACVGGFMALAELPALRGLPARIILSLAVAAGAWSLAAASPFLAHGVAVTHTRADTGNQFRPENTLLDRSAYDLVAIPWYFSNGKMDPRLESRLWVDNRTVRIGPDEIARRMEAAEERDCLLTTAVDPTAPLWLNLSPPLTLAPGEHLLLRFEFLDRDYRGWLIFKSEHTYRDYILPDSGWPLAFGVGPERSKVLSLWNSGDTAEEVQMYFRRADPAAAGKAFGDFARLHLSHYRPDLAPIRMRSWIPYRAEVHLPAPGWLETPRVYVPGYGSTVDGRPVPVSESPQYVVRVPVAAGDHLVEVRFHGTRRFWCAWWVSALAWLGLLGWAARRAGATGAGRPG